jgi:DNA polymerase-1
MKQLDFFGNEQGEGGTDMPSRLKRDKNCTRCNLHKTAEYVCLLGRGPIPCDVMIIGEAPGKREDDIGKPFQGRAGHLLDEILEEVGFKRKKIYITNAVHCRPPDNKTPSKVQIRECLYWLNLELATVDPKFVLVLGATAYEAITGEKGISKARGMPIEKDGRLYYPTFHPSAALHDERKKPVILADIRNFKKIVDKKGIIPADTIDYKIVTKETLDYALSDIDSCKVLSIDTEDSSLNPFTPGSWMSSFGIGTKTAQWTFPLNHYKGPLYNKYRRQKKLVGKVFDVIRGGDHIKVFHNGKFDTLWFGTIFDEWIECDFDTMLAHYNVDENKFHGLKYLSMEYFDAIDYDIPLEWKWGIAGTLEKHCEYLALDIYYTRKLYYLLKKELKKDRGTKNLFYKLTMPVSDLYTSIEYNGIYVSPTELKKAEKYWTRRSNIARRKLDKLFPSERQWKNKKTGETEIGVNWASPKQVGEILYDHLKIKVKYRTESGAPSTAEDVLIELADKHEIPELVLRYREAEKNLSTFIYAWMKLAIDNRFHPTFKIHGTVGGRPSAVEPNPQQTPRDPRLRSIIRARKGWSLVSVDLKQIELRLGADAADERNMIALFQQGGDPHTKIVQENFGIMKPTKEERKKGKAINFGYIYGAWWKTFKEYARKKFQMKLSDAECKKSRLAFFRSYPGFGKWHKRVKNFVSREGYVRSKVGRLRRLPNALRNDNSYEYKHAINQAINAPIQSLASDMNLCAAVELKRKMPKRKFRIVSTTHDEILMEIKNTFVNKALPKIKRTMERNPAFRWFDLELSVPIECEIEVGPWGDHSNNIEWNGEEIPMKKLVELNEQSIYDSRERLKKIDDEYNDKRRLK